MITIFFLTDNVKFLFEKNLNDPPTCMYRGYVRHRATKICISVFVIMAIEGKR